MVWVKRSVNRRLRAAAVRSRVHRYGVRLAAARDTAQTQYRKSEMVTLVLGLTFDRSHFRRTASVAVSSLEQDQSECQIECQNSACVGVSRACECLRGLVFSLLNPLYLR
jgi:hypothetical protein